MTTYFSTFMSGLQEVVEEALKKDLKNSTKIELLLDGLVVYRSNEPPGNIKKIRFLNNTFILFRFYQKKLSPKVLIEKVLQEPNIITSLPLGLVKNTTRFRVIASRENQVIALDKRLLSKIETVLSRRLMLKVNRKLPDIEVWFLTRREGYAFIGLRITKTPNYEKSLYKGELRPELAHIMCLLADLGHQDVVLDPFAGYGSIPLECVKHFSVKQIFAGEKDKSVFRILRNKAVRHSPKLVVGNWNALNLDFLVKASIDKIITDPPWGFYGKEKIDIVDLYKNILGEFSRILKVNGLIVILTAQKEIFEKLVRQLSCFNLQKKYDILVSGKKAAIYRLKMIKSGNWQK
ncbi:MAG: RsmD family RNA methyltransferase [Candidatus Shapirobacteria bacterium]|nr:RsmD family RNA methyltransferase [Candidatus Shapirobacteria bacterium]